MQARGALMIEHRLIERMIGIIRDSLERIEAAQTVDPFFIEMIADFIRTYADRTHHGKEEDILFRDLSKRALSVEDRKIMDELIEEHLLGRQTTKSLVDANKRYRNGDPSALTTIIKRLQVIVDFYPRHIEKEDKVFFPAARTYVTEDEDHAMLSKFGEFDRTIIHEKYRSLIEGLESR